MWSCEGLKKTKENRKKAKNSNTQKEKLKDKEKEELEHTSVKNGQLYNLDQLITLTT